MLITLTGTSGRSADPSDDPLDLLLACHGRIRQHLAFAQRLVDAVCPSVDDVSDSASSLVRYFGRALPLHIRDEDELLMDLLSLRAIPSDLREALSVMCAEHAVIDPAIEEAIQLWRRLRDEPLLLSSVRDELMPKTLLVSTLLRAHLDREERDIFPTVFTLLSAEEKQELTQRMRQRRQALG